MPEVNLGYSKAPHAFRVLVFMSTKEGSAITSHPDLIDFRIVKLPEIILLWP